jgi:hypothetical protein
MINCVYMWALKQGAKFTLVALNPQCKAHMYTCEASAGEGATQPMCFCIHAVNS